MKDISGKDLINGQTVAFNKPRYKGLTIGYVIGFTDQKVKVEWLTKYKFKDSSGAIKVETNQNNTLCWPKDVAIIVVEDTKIREKWLTYNV